MVSSPTPLSSGSQNIEDGGVILMLSKQVYFSEKQKG